MSIVAMTDLLWLQYSGRHHSNSGINRCIQSSSCYSCRCVWRLSL